jgi:hypothetical protein
MLRTLWGIRSHQVLERQIAISFSLIWAGTGVRQSVDPVRLAGFQRRNEMDLGMSGRFST